MAVYFECRTRTTMPPSEVFDRARSIDAHQDSMAKSREEAIAGVTSGLISRGEEVTWRAWHFGVPLQMTSRITEMESPDYFVDEQVKGPFRRFRHVHEFRPDPAGTTMIDSIEFAAPFGPVGRIAEKLVLGRYLRNLIETRNRYLTENLPRGELGPVPQPESRGLARRVTERRHVPWHARHRWSFRDRSGPRGSPFSDSEEC